MAGSDKTPVKKRPRRHFYKRKAFWIINILLVTLLVICAAIAFVYVESYTRPYRQRAATYPLEEINTLEKPSIIYDRNGDEIGRIFVQNRSIIGIEDVPKNFIQALQAGEDSRFFKHHGVDVIGTLRALKLTYQGSAQGGSTITQQLARNAYNLRGEAIRREETTIQRKLVEAFLAMRIEDRYEKNEILEYYLNRIYFGSGYYGLRSASLGYFGKEPKDLETQECASLVTLIKNPTGRSPINDPKANLAGRNYVLGRMREEGMIKRSELKELRARPLKLNPKPIRRGTSHLYERIADDVGRALGEDALEAGGFKIHTTILAPAQRAADKALRESLLRAEAHEGFTRRTQAEYLKNPDGKPDFLQGAVLMVDHTTGEVLAHVGGRDYNHAQYDFIELGRRPLGTAFFPFIYAAGLSKNLTPASLVEDEPMNNREVMVGSTEGIIGEWGMEVASPTYEGQIPLRRALESSKIAATIRVATSIGLDRVRAWAVTFGLPLQQAELLPRMAAGFEPVSMKQAVRAISAFAKGGKLGPTRLVYLDRVENSLGHVVFRQDRVGTAKINAKSAEAIDPATAWQVHSMMAGSLYRGSSKGALDNLLERPFHGAGKGGTTHDFSDAWFLGYNARVTCGVWTGFLSGQGDPIYPGAFSRDLAMPVWQATMNAAAPSFGGGTLRPPDNIVQVQVCSVSGQRATQFCQENIPNPETGGFVTRETTVSEFFRKGTENLAYCSLHSGTSNDQINPNSALLDLPTLDTSPIIPVEPALLGDDPYHTQMPNVVATSTTPGFSRHRTNVLDSLDLGDIEESIPLGHPKRLEIYED